MLYRMVVQYHTIPYYLTIVEKKEGKWHFKSRDLLGLTHQKFGGCIKSLEKYNTIQVEGTKNDTKLLVNHTLQLHTH